MRNPESLQAARDLGGLDRAADHDTERVDHFPGPGQLELGQFLCRERPVAHLPEVLARVDERQLIPAGRVGLDDVGGVDHAGASRVPGFAPGRSRGEQLVMDQAVFQGGKNVRSDVDLVPRRIDDFQCNSSSRLWPEPTGIRSFYTRGGGRYVPLLIFSSSFFSLFPSSFFFFTSSRLSVETGVNESARTSSIVDTRCTIRSSRSSGVRSSLTFFAFCLGRMTSLMPARRAARTFSLTPPIGRTRPDRVISPVIAISPRTGRPVSTEAIAVASETPADGPSFGMAPEGTWTCISALLKKSGSMPYSRACVLSHDSAARADSFMTSPSCPVRVSEPVPAIREASMNSTSPPAGVHARPMATPGSFVRSSISSSRNLGAPSICTTTSGVISIDVSLPSARRRATLRQSDPISRSRLRTPASRV